MKKITIVLGILVGILIVFLVGMSAFKSIETTPENVSSEQKTVLDIKENDWVKGDKTSKVVLVEYLDFECEACGAYYPFTKQLTNEYGDKIAFVVRYFPLSGHKNSRTAACAVEAAGKQGKFWEMYDILFTKQADWSEKQTADQNLFEKYAVEIGLDIPQWKKDVLSAEVVKRVGESYTEGESLGIQGAPTFFLNGKKMQSPKSYAEFTKIIDMELKK